jgi:hypothetical protein
MVELAVDLQKAINAHVAWKTRIALFNEGQDELDPSVIAQDQACDLGRIMAALPADVRSLPEYGTLQREHKTLHAAAAGLVMRIAGGERLPESELAMGSAFAELSSSVIHAMGALWRAVERAKPT